MLAELLDDVLDFYADAGAALGYRPTVEQIEARDPRELRKVALIGQAVRTTPAHRHSLSRVYVRQRVATLWRRVYGLRCSVAAAEQLNRVAAVRDELRPPASSQADILLFPSFSWSGSQAFFIAHEVWHLIEAERGLLMEAEPIREGTATFAASEYIGAPGGDRFLRPPEACGDFVSLRRAGVGWIVAEEVESADRPLVELLRREVRSGLVEETMRRCAPRVETIAARVHAEAAFVEDFRRYVRRALAPGAPPPSPSGRDVVEAFRRVGAHALALEIEAQDLSVLLQDLRVHGLDPCAPGLASDVQGPPG